MVIVTEKLDLPRRAQIFNDYVAEDAAQKMQDDEGLLTKILDAESRLFELSVDDPISVGAPLRRMRR